jgi:phage I-like protein
MSFTVLNDKEVDIAIAGGDFAVALAKVDGELDYFISNEDDSASVTRLLIKAMDHGHTKMFEPLRRILKTKLDEGGELPTEILSQAGFETPVNEIPAGQENPQWIQLLPMGEIKTRDNRQFKVTPTGTKKILASLEAQKTEAVVDFQHATVNPFVGDAPAAGWLEGYDAREDGLWGLARWTEGGMEAKAKRKYRYISPVIGLDPDTREAISLHSASLVNSPAIDGMQPVVNSNAAPLLEDQPIVNINQQEIPMIEQLAASLGIGADVESFAAYVKDIVDGNAKMQASLSEAAGAVIQLRSELAMRDAADATDAAIKDGKIAATQRDWALKYAVTDNEGFNAFLECAPSGTFSPKQGTVLTDVALSAAGSGPLSEEAQVKRAESYAAEHNCSFETAYYAVIKAAK